jgi:hypothetical protein
MVIQWPVRASSIPVSTTTKKFEATHVKTARQSASRFHSAGDSGSFYPNSFSYTGMRLALIATVGWRTAIMKGGKIIQNTRDPPAPEALADSNRFYKNLMEGSHETK